MRNKFWTRVGATFIALVLFASVASASGVDAKLDQIIRMLENAGFTDPGTTTTTSAPTTTTTQATTTTTQGTTTTQSQVANVSVTVFDGNRARVSVVPNNVVVIIRNPSGVVISRGRSGDVPAQYCCFSGTYTWSTDPDPGWTANPATGSFVIGGSAPTTTTTQATTTTTSPTTTTTSGGGTFDPRTIDCASIGTVGTPVNDQQNSVRRNIVINGYGGFTRDMTNVRINGGQGDAAIGNPPGTGVSPGPFHWNRVYLTLAGYLDEDSTSHSDAFQAWSYVAGNNVIERSCFGVAQPGPYPTTRRPNSLVIIKSDIQAGSTSNPISNITIRDSLFDLTNGNGYNFTIYVRDANTADTMPSATYNRMPRFISFINVWFKGGNPTVSTSSSNTWRAIFVRTEAERQAGIDRQNADPNQISQRMAVRSLTTDTADARTWIVWEAYDAETGQPILPPGGYYTDVP